MEDRVEVAAGRDVSALPDAAAPQHAARQAASPVSMHAPRGLSSAQALAVLAAAGNRATSRFLGTTRRGIQRKLVGGIQGDTAPDVKDSVHKTLHALGAGDPDVAHMLDPNNREILLVVTVKKGKTVEDQTTQVEWATAKTKIFVVLVHVDKEQNSLEKLNANLIHEIQLHAVPAVRKHRAAGGKNPGYPTSKGDVRAEEKAEHSHPGDWAGAMRQALANGGQPLFERVVADAASHDEQACVQAVGQFVDGGTISHKYASDLLLGLQVKVPLPVKAQQISPPAAASNQTTAPPPSTVIFTGTGPLVPYEDSDD